MIDRGAGSELLGGINTLVQFGVAGNLSDAQLLARFLARGGESAEAAFEALVARHGQMVLDVCSHILRDPHDAEDAFQATFLVLASRAGSIRQADALAGWLLGVARRLAMRFKSSSALRRAHEVRAAEFQSDRAGDTRESWPELHEEIERLPDRYREPVVLCYLEGLSTEAAAVRLGCPKGTVLSRLSRARERLRGRLLRRGLTPVVLADAAGSSAGSTALLTHSLLRATTRASLAFSEPAAAANLVSTTAAVLAKGVINAMMISKLKVVGAAVLACLLTLGGLQTFARQLAGRGGQAGANPSAEDRQAALARSAEKLQSELDELLRRNVEMREALRKIRADLEALRASVPPARAVDTNSARSASRLADALKRHPGQLKGSGCQIYMMDLVEGGTTLLADEPVPGHFITSAPKWSHDGSRIVFQTMQGSNWPHGPLMMIDLRNGRPTLTPLGDGSLATFSPDDQQIAFTLYPSVEAGLGGGVWVMRADGSDRHRAGELGAPFWSPGGRDLLINFFTLPTTSTVVNLETGAGNMVRVEGHQILSWPTWAGPDRLVTGLTAKGEPDSIVLLDVRTPAKATVIEVLWKRTAKLDVTPRHMVIRPGTGECFFVGAEAKRRGIYVVERDGSGRARPLGVMEYQGQMPAQQLGVLSFSPGGRYLLFQANRPQPE